MTPLKLVDNVEATVPEKTSHYPLISCHRGNAQRLFDKYGHQFRWIKDWNRFALYDPYQGVWSRDESEAGMWGLSDEIQDDILTAYGAEAYEEYMFTKMRAGTIKFCRSVPGVEANSRIFDGNPDLYNVANGTIDLNTGALLPWAAKHFLMQRSDVVYLGLDAPEPERYNRFLEEIWRNYPKMPAFWKRVTGFTLTGHIIPAQLFVMFGSGGNGKSVLLDVLKALHGLVEGVGYGGTAKASMITERDFQEHAEEFAVMYGKRFITYGEPKEGAALTENVVKDLTGGDRIQARFLYGHNFTFLPTAKNFIPTNHLPEIRGTDNGIRRRVCLIPFDQQWTEDEALVTTKVQLAEKGLKETLLAELPLILAQAVRGCLEFKRDGLKIPDAVSAATKNYIASQDKKALKQTGWAAFVASGRILLDPNAPKSRVTKLQELQPAYNSWAQMNGHPVITASKDFAELVNALPGVGRGSDKGWHGIYLNNADAVDRQIFDAFKAAL